jgi:hypothetical protein
MKTSSAQTMQLIALRFLHQIMPFGSRAIPPVGNFTLPQRFLYEIKFIVPQAVLYGKVLN